ncbi:MAG: hypothetical protein KGL35_01245 [Bradyrhizobium sp.]|nr:hypothetical protein [Bradyrhizobium sp.]
MTHRPRFVVACTAIVALGIAAWRGGLMDGFASISIYEAVMIAALCAYAGVGIIAAFRGRFDAARHVANGLPIVALCMTGAGILLAVAGLGALTPAALTGVFRNLALAISPNVVGIALMAAIREAMFWSAGEGI